MERGEKAAAEAAVVPWLSDAGSPEVFDPAVGRQAKLARNFIDGIEPYLAGDEHEGVRLRSHQSPALRELRELFEETEYRPDRRVLWPSPPSFGKSTMAALVVRETGVGKPMPDHSRPLQAVLLVPRDVARQQVIKSCGQIVPDVKVSAFTPKDGEHAMDYADMLVMTYHGSLGLTDEQWRYISGRTDLLLLDEVHRGIGEQISARLRETMDRYRPTTIALSATPEFTEARSAARVLQIDRSITPMTPREAAETGVANGVQLIALQSGVDVRFNSRRQTITETDLAPLVVNPVRNKLILSVMRDMGTLGVRGLVQCIPGGRNAHAELIAQYARAQHIKDPQTGEVRRLRVETVGMHKRGNEELIRLFKEGQLDALAFSKYLVEAFDDDNVRYVLAAAPTSSAVDMGQLVGRGARLGNPRVTKLFALIDNSSVSAQKVLQTPFHVYGAANFYQGEVIQHKRERQPGEEPVASGVRLPLHPGEIIRKTESVDIYEGLSTETRAAMQALSPGTILDQILITNDTLRAVPPDYEELMNQPAISEGRVTFAGVQYVLKGHLGSDGRPLMINVTTDHKRTYVSPEARRIIEERYVFSRKVSRLAIQNFLIDQGWPALSFDGFVTACKEAEVEFDVQHKTIRMDVDDALKMLYIMAETPLADPQQEVHMANLAAALQASGSTEILNVVRKDPALGQEVYDRRRGWQPSSCQPVKVISLTGAVALATECMRRWPKRAEAIGKTPAEVVEEVQAQYRQYLWERKLHPTLPRSAIDGFLENFKQDGENVPQDKVPAQTGTPSERGSRGSSPVRMLEAPSPLLAGYRLSGHGSEWREHAKCRASSVDLFVEKRDKAITKKAVAICQGCAVKADCLLFSLKVESEGTAGGLRHAERARLLPITSVIEGWLRQNQNPQGAPRS